MAVYQLDDLRSWLKFIDDNYISDEDVDAISELDINNFKDQRKIIEALFKPEYEAMDELNRNSFYKILELAASADESQLFQVFDFMSFGYVGDIINKQMFIANIKSVIDGDKVT